MAVPNQRYIITGGPGFGKTTIINRLEELGHEVCHENSREIIKEQLDSGGNILPWNDVIKFTEIVVEKRIQTYNEIPKGINVFFDRGIPDALAFLYRQELEVKEHLRQAARDYKYNTIVFVTPPWHTIFKNDNERRETFAESSLIHSFITQTYANLGYKLVDIPPGELDKRVEFVLNYI